MELLQLKYFKDAAKLENFSKAARKNMVPQPSISSAIKRLEDELGVQLFDRVGKKIYLNENGTFFYKQVTSILNTLDECTLYFSNVQKKEIIIYIQDGDFFLSQLAADFTSMHQNTHIGYASVEQVMHSKSVPYDFTFLIPSEDMGNLTYETILSDNLIAIVSKKHPLSQYDTIDVSQLRDENFVGLYNTIPIRIFTEYFCREYGGFEPNYVFKSHEDFATIYKVAKNSGVAILPEKYYYIHPSDNIKVLKFNKTIASNLAIAWDKHKVLSPLETSFLNFTRKWFSEL